MAANSAIEWTTRTWQLTCGCLLYSSGCAHCYAERMAARLKAMALADIAKGKDPGRKRPYIEAIGDDGRWSGNVAPNHGALADPLGWRLPQLVFVDSMSDLFFGDEWDQKAAAAKGVPFTPVPFEFIAAGFGAMALTRRHTYQVLTKRADRLYEFFKDCGEFSHPAAYCVGRFSELSGHKGGGHNVAKLDDWPLPNVWIGCSAEDQKQAVIRHRSLVDVPAAVRFWSLEPLIGPIDALPLNGIGWVIVGGESGPGARSVNIAWIRSIVRQCQVAGVPCFVKQLGSHVFDSDPAASFGVGGQLSPVTLALKHSKGGDPAEWPEDLRVRQWPAGFWGIAV